MGNPQQVFEYADIGQFEIELALSSPNPHEDIIADLSIRSTDSSMAVTLPLEGSDVHFLSIWLRDVLQRYQAEQAPVIDAED